MSDDWWNDGPEMEQAMSEARAQLERCVRVPCAWNLCVHEVDPLDNKIIGGMGPVMCPCDHLKGWRSPYVAGQAKPRVPAKTGGRNGSRVQRSRRRHVLPDYSSLGEWIPARSVREVSQ